MLQNINIKINIQKKNLYVVEKINRYNMDGKKMVFSLLLLIGRIIIIIKDRIDNYTTIKNKG